MKTIQQVIEESTATGKRLLAENPGMTSAGFEFTDFNVDEMRAAAKIFDMAEPEYRQGIGRFAACYSPGIGIYIHIRSVKVKVREVIEEEN